MKQNLINFLKLWSLCVLPAEEEEKKYGILAIHIEKI